MQVKENMVSIFIFSYSCHSDVTKCGTVFSHESKSIYVVV